MIKAVLLFAAVVGAAFGAGYAWGTYDAMPEPEPPADAEAGDSHGQSGPYYVEAGQLVVPVLAKGRTLAFILAQVTLEARSNDEAILLRRRLPHARSAMLESLFGLAGSGSFDGPAVDTPAISAALLRSANESYANAPVKSVLLDRLLRQDNTRL